MAWTLVLASAAHAQCDTAPVALDETVEHLGTPIVASVLANDHDPDGELLTLSIVSDTCTSVASADLDLVVLTTTLDDLCTVSYRVTDESNSSDTAVLTVRLLPLFADSFETGDLSRWSAVVSESSGPPEGPKRRMPAVARSER